MSLHPGTQKVAMSTLKINFPPGLTAKPSGAGLWNPRTESVIDSLHSASPFGAVSFPTPSSAPVAPSPETVFLCQQLTEMIFTSSYPHEQASWVHELTDLTLSLSAQLTASRDALAMEAARSANAQATSEELRKNLTTTEEALATTANMLAVQATNAASANARLGDERAIANAVIKDLVLKEEALEQTTAMVNAQYANLESAHAILHEKDQKIYAYEKKIRQKNHEIFFKNLEIQEEKQLAGDAIHAKFSEYRETISRLIVGAGSELSTEGSGNEESESSIGRQSTDVSAESAALGEALAEKVELLIVEEHRTARLRNLLNQSIIEVGRLKICLEEAADTGRDPLLESSNHMGSQTPSSRIAELEKALAEKTSLLNVEKHSSASLRHLLNQSIIEVGSLKIRLEEATDTTGPPLLETLKDNHGTPDTPSGEKGQRHGKPHQASNNLRSSQKEVSARVHTTEGPVNNTDGSEYLTDGENGSTMSTATTQVQNEEPIILHISEGALLGGEEPKGEPTTPTTEVTNQEPFVIHTREGDFTLSSLGEDGPYMKEEHKG